MPVYLINSEQLGFSGQFWMTKKFLITKFDCTRKMKTAKKIEQNRTEQTNPIKVTALKPSKHRKSFISTVLGIHYELLGHKNERQK